MAWEPKEVKEIRKQGYYDGKNKRVMRRHEGCNRTAYIYNTDADTEKELERITEIKTRISEKETIQVARDNLRRLRLRIKMPKDIIHLFDDLLIKHGEIYFPYLTHTENLIVRHRANGKSLPQIAKAMSGGNRGSKRNSFTTQQIKYLLQKIRTKIRKLDPNMKKSNKGQVKDFMNKITPETVFAEPELKEKKTRRKTDIYTRYRNQVFDERYIG